MSNPRISIICAMDERRGIGKNNKLPWHIPEDLARFRKLTTDHPVIMGRKTFESIGRLLPQRTNIIVTKDPHLDPHKFCLGRECDVFVAHSLREAIERAKESPGSEEIFIIGGGQIYAQALPLADRLYLTLVEGDYGGDTFFPEYVPFFKKKLFEKHGEFDNLKYKFVNLEREKEEVNHEES